MNGTRGRVFGGAGQGGVALILVLWVVVLLSTMALAMLATGRTETLMVRNHVDEVRFRARADGAVAYAFLRVTAVEEQDRWWPDGTAYELTLDGEPLTVRMYDEASLVDLNRAPDGLLLGLLQAVGMEVPAADALLDAIKDWRDADDTSGPKAFMDAQYRAAGLPYGTKRGLFESVEELRQVLGVSDELYRVLRPNLSVDARGRLNLAYAPPLVRAAAGQDLTTQDQQRDDIAGGRGPVGNRIRVWVADAQGGAAMEALVTRGSRTGAEYGVAWRRLLWPDPGAQAGEPGESR